MYKIGQQLQKSTEYKEHTMKRMRYIVSFTMRILNQEAALTIKNRMSLNTS